MYTDFQVMLSKLISQSVIDCRTEVRVRHTFNNTVYTVLYQCLLKLVFSPSTRHS